MKEKPLDAGRPVFKGFFMHAPFFYFPMVTDDILIEFAGDSAYNMN